MAAGACVLHGDPALILRTPIEWQTLPKAVNLSHFCHSTLFIDEISAVGESRPLRVRRAGFGAAQPDSYCVYTVNIYGVVL